MKKGKMSLIFTLTHWLRILLSAFMPTKDVRAEQLYKPSSHIFFLLPIILGGVSSIAILNISHLGGPTFISTSIIIVSVFIGWVLNKNYKKALQDQAIHHKNIRSKFFDFNSKVMPIWSKQLSSSRDIGDRAVSELTELFGDIVKRLDAMLRLSKNNVRKDESGNGLLEAIEKNHVDIQSVFEDLKAALTTVKDSKDLIMAEITMYSANMKEMADESKGISMKSKMIALNAEIEAARAGEAGMAFAAVVSEMRELANLSSSTSDMMSKKVDAINTAMTKFYKDEEAMEDIEEQHVTSAERLIQHILERFNEVTINLEESIESMESDSAQIKDDISSSLVSMQFQDRLSQILAHVVEDIDAFNKLGVKDIKKLDAESWLNDMEKRFSMEEEYNNLRGGSDVTTSPSLLTYF